MSFNGTRNSTWNGMGIVCGKSTNCTMLDAIDPDVAGIGVILSFLLATFLTVTTMTVAYFTRSLPHELYNKLDNSIVDRVTATKIGKIFNWIGSLSRRALEFITYLFVRKSPSESLTRKVEDSSIFSDQDYDHEEYEERKRSAMERFMLSLSDQQLFTGIAVVISACSRRCEISYVSFGIATQLAWCSCITHLVTLSSLRTYLDDNRRTKRFRISLVAIMFLLLLAMVMWLNSSIPANPPTRTLLGCATQDITFAMLTNALSLGISNYIGLRELIPGWRDSVFDESGISIDAPERVREFWRQGPYCSTLSTDEMNETSLVVIVDQYSTSMWSRLSAILLTSAYQFFAVIWRGLLHHKTEWGFGQIMPVILIALPVVSAIEGYWEWDKEPRPWNVAEQANDISHALSALEQEVDLRTTTPSLSLTEASPENPEGPEEMDITEALSQENSVDGVINGDSMERLLHGRLDTSQAELAPTTTQRTSTVDLNEIEQGSFTSILRHRTNIESHYQISTSNTTLSIPPDQTITTEKPWRNKLHRNSHVRRAFIMAFLQFTTEAISFETLILGMSMRKRDLVIFASCLIPPAIYWWMIINSWYKLNGYRSNQKATVRPAQHTKSENWFLNKVKSLTSVFRACF